MVKIDPMVPRTRYERALRQSLKSNPVTSLLGPRQAGKSTLARQLSRERPSEFYDLEDPRDRARLSSPSLALSGKDKLIVLDEVQRMPELFELLRVLADEREGNGRFLLLGSASPHLIKGVSESLAGRVGFVDLSGFDTSEVGAARWDSLWIRGGFPRSFLAQNEATSFRWRNDFIRTFLERDVVRWGVNASPETLRRFWTMLAHYHGQTWNAAEFARSLGSSENTARKYLDVLSGAYVIRQLQPWHANIKKRQVKSPKVYIRDSGLLHALLAIPDQEALLGHPKLGASWEGFVVSEIVSQSASRDVYFWATHTGAELDLLMLRDGKAIGFEVKYNQAPRTTRSMRSALADLNLEHLYIVYPGDKAYPLDDKISVLPLSELSF